MPILIQKFGGASVSSQKNRKLAIDRILNARAQGYDVVAVVSAMGRRGEPYATDTLLELVNDVSTKLDAREIDLLLACGEIISAAVFVAELRQHCEATMLTGYQAGIVTDDTHGKARVIDVKPERISRVLASGKVAVVAGFQGRSQGGETTTLGRGGSDTTAAVLGVALQAEAVEIYTDVPGIMTADPNLVPQAQVLSLVDYQEMLQLAYEGAKVLHARAIELAMYNNIPILVKTPAAEHEGTRITSTIRYEAHRAYSVIGVAYKKGLMQVNLPLATTDSGFDCRLFSALARANISVDLINVSPEYKVFIADENQKELVEGVLDKLAIAYDIRVGCSKVSVVGVGMRSVPGIMATLCRALHEAQVPILQTSDSHLTVSCLVDERHLIAAVNALHSHFCLTDIDQVVG